MKSAIKHAADRHDLSLLRLYDKYLSMEYTPHTIKKVLAALTGREDYDAKDTLPRFYDEVTSVHLDAYCRVLNALGSGHPAWSPMAQAAALYPEQTDAFIEYAGRGVVEPRKAMEAMNKSGRSAAEPSIVSAMGELTIPQPTSHAVTI